MLFSTSHKCCQFTDFAHITSAMKKEKSPVVALQSLLRPKYLIDCWALPNKSVSSLVLLVRQRWTFSSRELKWKSMYLSMSGSMTSPDSVSRGQRSLISTTWFPVWIKKQQQIKLTFKLNILPKYFKCSTLWHSNNCTVATKCVKRQHYYSKNKEKSGQQLLIQFKSVWLLHWGFHDVSAYGRSYTLSAQTV